MRQDPTIPIMQLKSVPANCPHPPASILPAGFSILSLTQNNLHDIIRVRARLDVYFQPVQKKKKSSLAIYLQYSAPHSSSTILFECVNGRRVCKYIYNILPSNGGHNGILKKVLACTPLPVNNPTLDHSTFLKM